jgi:hypothetical protein
MRPVETILRNGEGGIKENNGGGMNLTKIYSMHLCKCGHNAPQYNNNMTIKITVCLSSV